MKKELNVLVLAQYFSPDMGGASTRATNVVNGLINNNCAVTVIAAVPHYPSGNIPKDYSHKPILPNMYGVARVYRVWVPALPHNNIVNRLILHFSFSFSSLFALPFVGRIDIVWGANPNLFSFFPCFVYSTIKRVPIVRNIDDLWPEVFYELGYVRSKIAKKLLDFTAWLSYRVPAAITPISSGYKHSIVSKYGIPPKKVHVIEVGVDKVKPLSAESKQLKNKFVVMYSGVLGLGYDFDIILESAKLLESNENISFIIRGVGEEAINIKKAIRHLGLKNVTLTTDYLPKPQLDSLLNSADVFILPMANLCFVEQGLPTKVFEYQSHGKPIICVSKGQAARYIEDTRSGLIVNPKNVTEFVKAIDILYTNRALCLKMGKNGWDFVAKNLVSDKIGQKMYDVLNVTSESYHKTEKELSK